MTEVEEDTATAPKQKQRASSSARTVTEKEISVILCFYGFYVSLRVHELNF